MCALLVALLCGTDCDLLQSLQAAGDVSRQILDDAQPAAKRRELAEQSADQAAAVIAAMVAGLPAGDEQEEYRRIPWIWRVAIAAGKRDQAEPLKTLLDASLPKEGEKLRDWQAVVIGGGIINGISQSGIWPKPRIAELVEKNEELQARWQQSLLAAATMADDPKIKAGTRYDALRMIALDPTQDRLAQLAKYLSDTNAELQMGAVSGLSDVDDPQATEHLAGALPNLTATNQSLAIDALLRSAARTDALLGLLRSGKVKVANLTAEQRTKLRELPNQTQRDRAIRLLEQRR